MIGEPCAVDTPAYMVGVFELSVARDDEPARSVGNVVVGNVRENADTFEGAPADGSVRDRRLAYRVRSSIDVICQMDEITCENLRDWFQGPAVNVADGTRIQLRAVQQQPIFRLELSRAICGGGILTVVVHRAFIVSTADLLFAAQGFSGMQLTFRALQDPDFPDEPFGYLHIAPGGCGTS